MLDDTTNESRSKVIATERKASDIFDTPAFRRNQSAPPSKALYRFCNQRQSCIAICKYYSNICIGRLFLSFWVC